MHHPSALLLHGDYAYTYTPFFKRGAGIIRRGSTRIAHRATELAGQLGLLEIATNAPYSRGSYDRLIDATR